MNANQHAERMLAAFEKDTRDNGEEFYKVSEDWWPLTQRIHDGMLPDDTKYRMIYEVLSVMTEFNEPDWDDAGWEITERLVDVYNMDLVRWLASHLERAYYVDQALDEGYVSFKDFSIFAALGAAQGIEYDEIYRALVDEFRELAETDEETDA